MGKLFGARAAFRNACFAKGHIEENTFKKINKIPHYIVSSISMSNNPRIKAIYFAKDYVILFTNIFLTYSNLNVNAETPLETLNTAN